MGLADDLAGDLNQEALEKVNVRLSRQLAEAKAKSADLVAAVYEAAKDAALIVGKPSVPKPPVKDRRTRREEVALWHLTDFQGGKKTVSYDLDVMDQRVNLFCEKAAKITEIQRADHPVRKCVIMLGGDMIENTQTFPGQVWQVHADLFTQLFRVAARLEAVAVYALGVYDEVEFVCEPGNHGRIGSKRDGVKISDNWDRIVYQMVADKFTAEPRITWKITEGWYQPVEIGNYRAMLIHGDEVKGFGGQTPAYALCRKGNAWASGAVPFRFRDIYVGHYHNHNDYALAAGGTVFMTGSPESDNEFAAEFVAAASTPSQRLHFIDAEQGRVGAQYKLYLSDDQ